MSRISEAEKKARWTAVESVIGTHAMEGLTPDAATRQIMGRYAEGELTLEQFSEAMQHHADSVLAEIKGRSLAGAA